MLSRPKISVIFYEGSSAEDFHTFRREDSGRLSGEFFDNSSQSEFGIEILEEVIQGVIEQRLKD